METIINQLSQGISLEIPFSASTLWISSSIIFFICIIKIIYNVRKSSEEYLGVSLSLVTSSTFVVSVILSLAFAFLVDGLGGINILLLIALGLIFFLVLGPIFFLLDFYPDLSSNLTAGLSASIAVIFIFSLMISTTISLVIDLEAGLAAGFGSNIVSGFMRKRFKNPMLN